MQRNPLPWLGVVALAAVAWPAGASAQFSYYYWSMPSLTTCQQPGYLASSSSVMQSHCRGLMNQEFERLHDEGERNGTVLSEQVPELDSRFTSQPVAVEAIRLSDADAAGAGGQSSSLRELANWAYSYDSTQVNSCQEFVWQRFYDYEQLMRAASQNESARAVFDTAYGSSHQRSAIATRGLTDTRSPMRDMSSRYGISADQATLLLPSLPETWPGVAGDGADRGVNVVELPKNDYFALNDEELNMMRWRDYGLWQTLLAGRSYYRMSTYRSSSTAPNAWEWHRMMSDAMAEQGVSDVELGVLAGRRRSFRTLLGHRRSLRSRGLSQSSSAVRAVNAQIHAALRVGVSDGCLSWTTAEQDPSNGRYDVGRCDWAPEDFVTSLTRTFENEKQGYRRLCERFAPSSFSSLSGGYDYFGCSNLASCDYHGSDPRTSDSAFNSFLVLTRASEGYVLAALTDESQAPTLRFDAGDSQTWGDASVVSATFSHWARGGVVDNAWGGGAVEQEDVNPNLDVGARVTGSVFGESTVVANAQLELDVRRNERSLDLEVFGIDYYTGGWEQNASSRGELDVTRTGGASDEESRTVGFNERFFVGPVPVSLSVNLVATVGIDAGFDVDVNETCTNRDYWGNVRNCDIDGSASAHVEPYIDVTLHGHAGVDALLFDGGIEAQVLLARVGLPVSVTAEVSDSSRGPELSGQTSAAIQLTSLSGHITGYVEAIGERYSRTILDWPAAYDETLPLYTNDFTFSFADLAQCANARVTCE